MSTVEALLTGGRGAAAEEFRPRPEAWRDGTDGVVAADVKTLQSGLDTDWSGCWRAADGVPELERVEMDDPEHLIGAYFHQRWDVQENRTWGWAVDDFAGRSPDRIARVPKQTTNPPKGECARLRAVRKRITEQTHDDGSTPVGSIP